MSGVQFGARLAPPGRAWLAARRADRGKGQAMAADRPDNRPRSCSDKQFSTGAAPAAPQADRAVIDLSHLDAQTLGDRALGVELLALFDEQSARITARLIELGEAEPRARIDLAHTLRGAALAIGAFEAARMAQAYETACAGQARPPLDGLAAAVTRARAAIARLLDRPPHPPGEAAG
jgi:HPt (histidine-containing phosphotransfer) domain-containing protein